MGWARAGKRLRLRVLLHRRVRRSLRRVHGRAARAAAEPRRRSALQSRNHARRSLSRAAARRSRCRARSPAKAAAAPARRAGTKPEQCPTCSGIGKVRAQQGFFTIERTCPNCRGQGRIIRNPCKACRGTGHVQKERTLAVDIPPGVEEGTRIRLVGRRPGGREWRARRRSLHFPFGHAASDFPARRARSLLPRAGDLS